MFLLWEPDRDQVVFTVWMIYDERRVTAGCFFIAFIYACTTTSTYS